ncbi:hypothetical protein GGF50DRAFT_99450 [Schizophyllum commune]
MPKATQKFSKQIGPVTYDNGNCSKCGRYISRSSDFARHAITHMELGDKDASMYYCPHEGCAYKTLQKSNLESHFNVHTGEKPYACPECPFSSANPSSLCRHRQRLHGYVPSARRTRPGSGPATFSRPRVPQEDGPVMNGTPAATVPRRTGRASKNQNNPVDNNQSDHDAQGQPSQHPPPDQQQQQAQHPPPPPPPPQPLTFINHAPPPPDGMINGPIPMGPPMPHMMFPPHFAHFVPMQGGPPPMGPPPSGPPPMGHIQHVHMGPLPPVPPPLGMPPPPGMHPQGMPQAPPPPPLVPQAPAPPEAERSAPSPPRAPGEAEEKPKIEKRSPSPSSAKAASPASVSRSPSPKATSNVREVSDLRTPVV